MTSITKRRTIEMGDTGDDVAEVQAILGLPIDSEFGPCTDSAVQSFQAAYGLEDDGVVGPATWDALDDLAARVDVGDPGLGIELQSDILLIVQHSDLAKYKWKDRGVAPLGYLQGMALTYALAVKQYYKGGPITFALSQPAGDPEYDALAYFEEEFRDVGMSNQEAGIDTLRHLFVLLIGLGMRESSGKYYEGRDMSAENTASDTCEGGLFQTSWNIKSCSPDMMGELLKSYCTDPNGWLNVFSHGLSPTADGLSSYGSGEGAVYQWLAKYSPAFTVFVTALGLRKRRAHWGPIVRHEAEVREEADELLAEIQTLVEPV